MFILGKQRNSRGGFFLFCFVFGNLLAVLGLHSWTGFPPVAMSGGYDPVGVLGLLAPVAALVAELGLWVPELKRLWFQTSRVQAP